MAKLIKRGQQGIKVVQTAPYNAEVYLEKDPISHPELQTYIPGLDPEERMDQTVQELTPRIDPFTNKLIRPSTYLPILEQKQAGTGTEHPTSWMDYVAGLVPLAIPAIVSSPYWAPAAATTLTSPAFWTNVATKTIPNLIKDTALYTAADAASEGITGKGIGAHVNNAIGLSEEEHPIGEAMGFIGTSLFEKPLEKGIISAYKGLRGAILPEYALSLAMNESLWKPYVSRIVQENGKIRLRLPSHTDATPREIVLEPQGNNKFYVHVRTWDGEKIPAHLSERDKGYLYEALYNELPEGAEILFPESGPGNYATRGTVAGLLKLGRDSRFSKGSSGTLQYIDKDGSIKEFTGTSFIKTPNLGKIIYNSNTTPNLKIPDWTPISKNYGTHSNDYVTVAVDKHGPVFTLKNSNGETLGDLALLLEKNGVFSVSNINSYKPGGSGPLYNAAIRYGLLRYGNTFKGIRSGDLLASAEQTTNVTSKFPSLELSQKGAHFYGNEYRKGPVLLLTGESSYYPTPSMPLIERLKPQLSIPERFGIPKGERGNLTLDLTEALSDLYQYITSGRYRQNFVVDSQGNFIWGNSNQGVPAYYFLRDHGITGRGDNAWMDAALLTDYGKGWLRYSPVLNATHWTQRGFPEVKGMSWIPGEAKMAPYPNGTNSLVLTPQSNEIGAQLANELGNPNLPTTIPKKVMRNFWGNVTTFQRPGTYLSGDAGNAPLGNFLIKDYINNRRTGIFPILNQEGNITSITRMGLSPDSYSSIIRQAGRNPAYELRWGEGFRNWNDSAIENKYIYDAWLKWKKGEISISEYKKIFDLWAETIGGRPLEIQTTLGKQYPIHPHPFLYRRKQGGKLNIQKNNL